MKAKPKHLAPKYGAQFKDNSVATAYAYRPPYPDELFEQLLNLMPETPRRVLDVGCGTGYLARPLSQFVDAVDAVDFSANMIAQGQRLPHGDAHNLNWIYGPVEEVSLTPPYALITAGESLHWMAWDIVLPKFQNLLKPGAFLAIVGKRFSVLPWAKALGELISQFSTNQDFEPYKLVDELAQRGLFTKQGEFATAPMLYQQTVEMYIEAIHSTNGFSRERMDEDRAAAFDTAVRQLVAPYCENNHMEIQVNGHVVWGYPHSNNRLER